MTRRYRVELRINIDYILRIKIDCMLRINSDCKTFFQTLNTGGKMLTRWHRVELRTNIDCIYIYI